MAANPFITPDVIRLFLLDRASDNFLLDEEQFKDDSIDLALILTVDLYNTTDPFVDFHTPASFPYRSQLLLGVTSYLLLSRAINMLRNRVNYQTAGGVTVDEKSVAEQYIQLSKQFKADFIGEIKKIKTQINVNQGFGAQGSPYAAINQGGGLFP